MAQNIKIKMTYLRSGAFRAVFEFWPLYTFHGQNSKTAWKAPVFFILDHFQAIYEIESHPKLGPPVHAHATHSWTDLKTVEQDEKVKKEMQDDTK